MRKLVSNSKNWCSWKSSLSRGGNHSWGSHRLHLWLLSSLLDDIVSKVNDLFSATIGRGRVKTLGKLLDTRLNNKALRRCCAGSGSSRLMVMSGWSGPPLVKIILIIVSFIVAWQQVIVKGAGEKILNLHGVHDQVLASLSLESCGLAVDVVSDLSIDLIVILVLSSAYEFLKN